MWTLPKFEWPQQKQQCLTCAHYRPFPDLERYAGGGTVMCCAANPWKGRRGIGSCIDNRSRGPCGPDAKLWKGLDMTD